jgi:hypothetical protein
MKGTSNFYLIIICFILFSCQAKNSDNGKNKKDSIESLTVKTKLDEKDTIGWIKDFGTLRTALYEKNKKGLKSFFNFPINNGNNEIWYLIYEGNESKLKTITEEAKSLTEAEFDKNFDKIFPQEFVNSILKIKTDVLLKKHSYETIMFKNEQKSYKTYASYHKQENILQLNFYSETQIDLGEGEMDKAEFSIVYYFDIRDGHLIFKKILLAG